LHAILDANVLIAALLSPRGSPARLLRAWMNGAFELIVSPGLLAELERALAYPKLRGGFRRKMQRHSSICSGEAPTRSTILRRPAQARTHPISGTIICSPSRLRNGRS
jgi:predicted nucleic acid-binding protein